jgi:periodic tryptophan protein 1
MISSLSWVPRGVAKAIPDVAQPSEEELAATRQELMSQERDDRDEYEGSSEGEEMEAEDHLQAIQHAEAAAAAITSSTGRKASRLTLHAVDGISEAMKDLDMEHYDDSDDENIVARVLGGRGDAAVDEDGDPYITLGGEEDNESEDEDFNIKPTDLLILAARNEDDVSNLEVRVVVSVKLHPILL